MNVYSAGTRRKSSLPVLIRMPLATDSVKCGSGCAVAPHVQELEPDDDPVAVSIPVAGREVAIDAAADPAAFGPHGDLLGHVQAAVGLDLDGDVVGADALLGRRRERRQQAQPPEQEAADDAAEES